MYGMIPFTKGEANLFRYLDDLERGFFRSTVNGSTQFRCDIQDEGDRYLLDAELPGFNKEDINVELKDDRITISATHKTESEEKDKKENFIRRERHYGSFSRSFDVSDIEAADITASYKDGVLQLTLPKVKEAQPVTRSISVE
ncbi:MAG: Hsp20/alpha crystallin family protein [Oscillospiraceae bacterium]